MVDPDTKSAMAEAAQAGWWSRSGDPGNRVRAMDAITSAMLAAEARGFKLVGPEATSDMGAAGAEEYRSWRSRPWPEDFADLIWCAMHKEAPGWEDGK